MTKQEMRDMQARLNQTIIEKNDLIARLTEKLGMLLKEINKLSDDNKKIRRKLYGRNS